MTGPAEIRAVAIVRVSQRDGDPSEHSPEVQVRAIIEHCAQRGYRLDPRDILDENVDTNGKVRPVSGSWDLADRPKLAHAVALVQRRTHHVIVGERFDRLFRDLDVQRQTIKAVEAAGGRLESPKQGALTHATAESELHATMDGAVAQYTKRTAMDRARDAVAVAIEQGKSPAPVPAGYRRVDGHLEPGPAKEVSTVRDAFEKRANGATIAEVQAFLAKRGIHRTVSGVRNMLTSKLYIGEVHFGDYTPNLKAHDPIIDRDVFDAVQKMVVTAGRKAKSERLLARLGILKCASCDGRMSASSTSTGYAFYRCSSQACSKPVAIGADIVEREVIAAVVEAAGSRKGCAKLAHQARRAADQADRAQAAYERAQRILADSGDEAEAQRILGEKRQARDQARETAARLADLVGPEAVTDAAKILQTGPLDARRGVIRSRVRQVTIEPGRGPERITVELHGE